MVIAAADDNDYGDILALVELGEAKLLGERYNDRGVKEIAAVVGNVRPNAQQIRIGREFFTTALRDYDDWREKWWREAIQNAVDAGAKDVTCTIRETQTMDGDAVEVTVLDDGGGMDEDTLINKFLVLGGTTKSTGIGTTGGFGKAKELLVLPWLMWTIQTRNRIVRGSGVEYDVGPADYIAGTKLSVLMPADQATGAAAAEAFIGKCYLPRVRFTVNGEEVKADLRKGKEIRNFEGKATLYHNKSGGFRRMLVRANGIYMFNIYVSSQTEGTLVVELDQPSIELLTANRDGFRDSSLRYSVSEFANQLAADVKSALRAKKGLIREKFRGTGQFSSGVRGEILESHILQTQGALVPEGRGRMVMSQEQVAEMLWVLRDVDRSTPAEDQESATNFMATAQVAQAMLTNMEVLGTTQMEAAARQLSWEPDFFLVNEIEGWRVPAKFKPASMAKRTKQVLRFWAELCRFVLIQLSSTKRYGVGFVFSDDAGAQYIHEDDEDWLMLNPLKPSKMSGYAAPNTRDEFSLSSKEDLHWMYAAAVHECTHIADGIAYHDESFATAFTSNVAKTADGVRRLAAIKKAIVARK